MPANFQSPSEVPVISKPDLSHLGLDGLPVTQTQERSKSRPTTPPTSQPRSPRPDSGGQPQPQPGMYMPPGDVAAVSSQSPRASSRSRSTSQRGQHTQHPMHAAVPDMSPRDSGSRHQQQPQFGMHAVTQDVSPSPRRSSKSMQSGTPEASPGGSMRRGGYYSTADGSPLPSPRHTTMAPASPPRPSSGPRMPVPAPAAGNPYSSTKVEANASGNPHGQYFPADAEETAGLNSFGRPRGPYDPVTPRGRFRDRV